MIQKTVFKTKDYSKVKFSISANDAETIDIHGLNGDWDTPVEMKKKKDGSFSVEVSLPKDSEQQFKYRVNKTEWLEEPEADSQVADSFGGQNSVINL